MSGFDPTTVSSIISSLSSAGGGGGSISSIFVRIFGDDNLFVDFIFVPPPPLPPSALGVSTSGNRK